MDLEKLQSLGSMLTTRGAKLIEGIKAGAEALAFRPQVLDIGELKLITTSLVAEGGYSFVFTAREVMPGSEQGRILAVKKVIAQDPDTVEIGRTEMRLLKSLPPHPHIVRYYGGCVEKRGGGVVEMYMALEYCPGGSLVDLVMPGMPPIPEARLLSIFHSVCKAVAHLHAQDPPIAHRDLKLENVLCNENGLYKLCDFGSATTRRVKIENRAERLREEDIIQRFSTLMYRAPEMVDLHRGHEITQAVDIWALGCILYTLAFHRHPFDAGTELQIMNANFSIPTSSSYAEGVHHIIRYALEPDPSKRPTITQLIAKVAERRAAVLDDEIVEAEAVRLPGEEHPQPKAASKPSANNPPTTLQRQPSWDAFGDGALQMLPTSSEANATGVEDMFAASGLQHPNSGFTEDLLGMQEQPCGAHGQPLVVQATGPRSLPSAVQATSFSDSDLASHPMAAPALPPSTATQESLLDMEPAPVPPGAGDVAASTEMAGGKSDGRPAFATFGDAHPRGEYLMSNGHAAHGLTDVVTQQLAVAGTGDAASNSRQQDLLALHPAPATQHQSGGMTSGPRTGAALDPNGDLFENFQRAAAQPCAVGQPTALPSAPQTQAQSSLI